LAYKTEVTVLNATAVYVYLKGKHDKNELVHQHFAYTALIFNRLHCRRFSEQGR